MAEIVCKLDSLAVRSPKRQRTRARDGSPREPVVVRSLVLAHQIQAVLDDGRARSLGEVARQLGVTQPRVTQLMALLRLSPAIQNAILLGETMALASLSEHRLRAVTRETGWDRQQALFDELLRSQGRPPNQQTIRALPV